MPEPHTRSPLTSLARVQRGAMVLAGIVLLAVVWFRLLTGCPWIEALYTVVITIASVGFSERSEISPALQIYYIVVIVLGVAALGYTLGGFLQMVTEGEIQRAIGQRRTSREIASLSGHVILCGYGRMGQILATELARQDVPLVVVDRVPELIVEAQREGHLVVTGDATEEEVLLAAGVDRAKSLVTALANDAESVFIALTARNINKQLQIIARAEQKSTHKKLVQAGADRVISPATIGAQRIATLLKRPTTVELFEIVVDRAKLDVEVDELVIPPHSRLVGQTIAAIEARRKHGLLIVAIKQAPGGTPQDVDARMIFNPDPHQHFTAGDTLIVMSSVQSIAKFREEYQL